MSEQTDFITDVFSEFGPVKLKKMFGGHGVFFDGLMIGLLADDQLYLKVDKQSVSQFEDNNLVQFSYDKNGKAVGMSYYQAPDSAMDDPSEMRDWAALAYGAARRAKK